MTVDLTKAVWRKSRKSANNGGCGEVADLGGHVAVRDSKHPDAAPLVFTAFEWECFVDGVRNDEF